MSISRLGLFVPTTSLFVELFFPSFFFLFFLFFSFNLYSSSNRQDNLLRFLELLLHGAVNTFLVIILLQPVCSSLLVLPVCLTLRFIRGMLRLHY